MFKPKAIDLLKTRVKYALIYAQKQTNKVDNNIYLPHTSIMPS